MPWHSGKLTVRYGERQVHHVANLQWKQGIMADRSNCGHLGAYWFSKP